MLGSDLTDSVQYAYASKNSIGILIVLMVIATSNIKFSKKYEWIINILKVWFIIFLFLLQNRTGLLILLSYYLITIIIKKRKINIYKVLFFISIIVLFFVFKNKILNFLEWSLRLNVSKNLDDLSSGRLTLIKKAIESFKNNIWIGIPKYYIDNFFVCILAEYGLIGSSIVFAIVGTVIVDCIKYLNKKNNLMFFLMIVPLIASLFEAMPPFAPGAIYCTFWFIYGLNECS